MDFDSKFKKILEEKLENEEFLKKLYNEMMNVYKDKDKVAKLDKNDIKNFIIEYKFLEKLLPELKNYEELIDNNNKNNEFIYDNYLFLKIKEGKNILDVYQNENENNKLFFIIAFNGKKYISKEKNSSSNLDINESFQFELKSRNLEELLESKLILNILLVSKKPNNKVKVISNKQFEWKFLLSYKKIGLNIDMPCCDLQINDSLGIISIYLELFFNNNEYIKLLSEKSVETKLSYEKKLYINGNKKHFENCKNFWSEYKNINKAFEDRILKFYFKNENGDYKSIFSYLKPFYLNGIESPYHALRIVSLIEYEESIDNELLNSPLVFLINKRGNALEHSILLYGFLKAFSLSVYLVQGYSSDGIHFWIMTRENYNNTYKIKFWESLTGQIWESTDKRLSYFYRRIDSIINEESFYANIQEDDFILNVDFNLENRSKWKILKKENYDIKNWFEIGQSNFYNINNVFDEEKDIEFDLREEIIKYRTTFNKFTKFDQKMEYILNIALSNYEIEKIIGKTYCNNEFSLLIKNNIPTGYVFKAFPIQFTIKNSSITFEIMRKNLIFKEILDINGDDITFMVKTKIFNYIENIFSLWVIIAVRYIEINK